MRIRSGEKAFLKILKTKRFTYIANCNSCIYNYVDKYGEEGCHNSNVTQFDIVEDEGRNYCQFWRCTREA